MDVDFDSLGDQILPSFYAGDTTNAMNAERRRDSLAKCLRVVKSDIEREKKVNYREVTERGCRFHHFTYLS